MIKTATDRRLSGRATGATGYMVLFALAVLQLGAALHHDQHEATELTESCVACVQLEQFDDLVAAPASASVVLPGYAAASTPVAAIATSRLLRSYYGRAPPTVS